MTHLFFKDARKVTYSATVGNMERLKHHPRDRMLDD